MPRAKDTRNSRRWPKTDPKPDRHAPAAISPHEPVLPDGYYHEADAIEGWCCVQEWRDGAFRHDRACIMRLAAR
jgi:hypothetical protein